jgi:hypothetical protein
VGPAQTDLYKTTAERYLEPDVHIESVHAVVTPGIFVMPVARDGLLHDLTSS